MQRNLASRRNFDSVKAQLWFTCRVLKNSSIQSLRTNENLSNLRFFEVDEVSASLLGLHAINAVATVPNARRRFIQVEMLA